MHDAIRKGVSETSTGQWKAIDTDRRKPPRPFNLLRSFALLSLLCIGLFSTATAVLLNRFVSQHMMERDAAITLEFMQRIADIEEPDLDDFSAERLQNEEGLGELFAHIASMPNVVRANVFSTERVVIWSTAAELVGRQVTSNDELEKALRGQLVYEFIDRSEENKPEHDFFGAEVTEFLENYLPIYDARGEKVLGVAEVYKTPVVLFEAIRTGRILTWSLALAGGVFLYLTLFWIVRRASQVIDNQQQRLVETETLAAVGEMASAVAHGIRNPLASIRSSAELTLETSADDDERERAGDIIKEVDRLTQWIRELLLFARPERGQLDPIRVKDVLDESLDGFGSMMKHQSIRLNWECDDPEAAMRGDEALLSHAFSCLVSNAIEAMPEGGELGVKLRNSQSGGLVISIRDTGEGISKDHLRQIFKPFKTSKRAGIGLGMVLVKRIIERHGGRIRIQSQRGVGTLVELRFPGV